MKPIRPTLPCRAVDIGRNLATGVVAGEVTLEPGLAVDARKTRTSVSTRPTVVRPTRYPRSVSARTTLADRLEAPIQPAGHHQ
jgi:hypothetical protein